MSLDVVRLAVFGIIFLDLWSLVTIDMGTGSVGRAFRFALQCFSPLMDSECLRLDSVFTFACLLEDFTVGGAWKAALKVVISGGSSTGGGEAIMGSNSIRSMISLAGGVSW